VGSGVERSQSVRDLVSSDCLFCLEETCNRLPNPKNGYRIGNGLSVGKFVAYVCKDGYKLIGIRSRSCLASGQWSGTQPVCQKETCNRLPNPKNGYRIGDGLSVGKFVAYVCKDGYKLIGIRSRSCLASGQWSGTQPVCQSKI
jgi:CUB/sushi domain-containing protein